VRFLIDEQLPPALASWLAARNHTAQHVADLGLLGTSDREIARRALLAGAIMVTKDEEYADLRPRVEGLQVLWLRLGNLPNRVLLEKLAAAWDRAESRLLAGEAIVSIPE
jgi:predicted nuclease of predicted toxin-antitoxin system